MMEKLDNAFFIQMFVLTVFETLKNIDFEGGIPTFF